MTLCSGQEPACGAGKRRFKERIEEEKLQNDLDYFRRSNSGMGRDSKTPESLEPSRMASLLPAFVASDVPHPRIWLPLTIGDSRVHPAKALDISRFHSAERARLTLQSSGSPPPNGNLHRSTYLKTNRRADGPNRAPHIRFSSCPGCRDTVRRIPDSPHETPVQRHSILRRLRQRPHPSAL